MFKIKIKSIAIDFELTELQIKYICGIVQEVPEEYEYNTNLVKTYLKDLNIDMNQQEKLYVSKDIDVGDLVVGFLPRQNDFQFDHTAQNIIIDINFDYLYKIPFDISPTEIIPIIQYCFPIYNCLFIKGQAKKGYQILQLNCFNPTGFLMIQFCSIFGLQFNGTVNNNEQKNVLEKKFPGHCFFEDINKFKDIDIYINLDHQYQFSDRKQIFPLMNFNSKIVVSSHDFQLDQPDLQYMFKKDISLAFNNCQLNNDLLMDSSQQLHILNDLIQNYTKNKIKANVITKNTIEEAVGIKQLNDLLSSIVVQLN